jgi:hypothetical protein
MIHPSKIRIVNDDPSAVDYLELADLGSTTVSASNGREALEKVAVEAPDLILTGFTRRAVIAMRPRVTALWRSSRLPTCTRIPSRRSMIARGVSRFVSFVLGLALGTGIAILLATLNAWFSS